MANSSPLRSTLLDQMIVVGAIAAGIAVVRDLSWDYIKTLPAPSSPAESWEYGRGLVIGLLLPFGVIGTMTVLCLDLRYPRPPLRRLSRRPGVLACIAVTLVLTLGLSGLLVAISVSYWFQSEPFIINDAWVGRFLEIMASHCGFGVAVAWLTLACSGRWRPVPGWLDRIGIVLGVFWLGMIPLFNWPLIARLKL
jgi:hypothetical protein